MRGWFRAAAELRRPMAQPSKSRASAEGKCRYESSWRSSVPAVSSISISRNSSESKISPGTRQTRCLRAGKRSGLWDVCRRLPSFSGLRAPQRSRLDAPFPAPCRPPSSPWRGGPISTPAEKSASWDRLPEPRLEGCRLGGTPIWNCDRCSIRQIVAVFWAIANPFLMKVAAGLADFPPAGHANRALERQTKADVY